MLEALLLLLGVANLLLLVRFYQKIMAKLTALERVGVLYTAEKNVDPIPPPMSPRERIRWVERRMNGSLRATP